MPSTKSQLRGMGLKDKEIAIVPHSLRPLLMQHMASGGSFGSFFSSIKKGFDKVGDVMTKPVKLPSGVESAFNFMRDKVNPAIQKGFHAVADSNIPVVSTVAKPFASVMDLHQKHLGPQGSGISRSGGKMRHCSLCGSVGAVKTSCPLSSTATVRSHKRHPLARGLMKK